MHRSRRSGSGRTTKDTVMNTGRGESLRPDFAENASVETIRAHYERAQATADLWADRARNLFLLLCQREEQAATEPTRTPS